MIYVAATFVAVGLLVFSLYWWLIAAPEASAKQQLRRRLAGDAAVSAPATVVLAKGDEPLSDIRQLNAVLERLGGVSGPTKRLLEEADLSLTPGAFVLTVVACAMAAGLIAFWFLPFWWMALGAAALGGFLPLAFARFKRQRRLQQFEEQFPEAIELISRALRAGHAFSTGLRLAADELPAPVGPEFRLLFDRQNFGDSIPDAMRAFAVRIPLIDARFFVTAVLTQREAGGNLAEVLDRLASVMRDRFKVRREVRTKSAHGRITAWVLAAMPPSLALILFAINPEQMQLLWVDPLGQRLLLAASLGQILGTLVVRRIVDLEY